MRGVVHGTDCGSTANCGAHRYSGKALPRPSINPLYFISAVAPRTGPTALPFPPTFDAPSCRLTDAPQTTPLPNRYTSSSPCSHTHQRQFSQHPCVADLTPPPPAHHAERVGVTAGWSIIMSKLTAARPLSTDARRPLSTLLAPRELRRRGAAADAAAAADDRGPAPMSTLDRRRPPAAPSSRSPSTCWRCPRASGAPPVDARRCRVGCRGRLADGRDPIDAALLPPSTDVRRRRASMDMRRPAAPAPGPRDGGGDGTSTGAAAAAWWPWCTSADAAWRVRLPALWMDDTTAVASVSGSSNILAGVGGAKAFKELGKVEKIGASLSQGARGRNAYGATTSGKRRAVLPGKACNIRGLRAAGGGGGERAKEEPTKTGGRKGEGRPCTTRVQPPLEM